MSLEPATFRGSSGTAAAPGTAGFQWRPRGSFWRQSSLALSVGASAGEKDHLLERQGQFSPRKSLETLKHLLREREKPQTSFSCLPLRADSCRADPRDAP